MKYTDESVNEETIKTVNEHPLTTPFFVYLLQEFNKIETYKDLPPKVLTILEERVQKQFNKTLAQFYEEE